MVCAVRSNKLKVSALAGKATGSSKAPSSAAHNSRDSSRKIALALAQSTNASRRRRQCHPQQPKRLAQQGIVRSPLHAPRLPAKHQQQLHRAAVQLGDAGKTSDTASYSSKGSSSLFSCAAV